MNITLWIVQGILAFAFLAAGLMKLTSDKNQLREKVGVWVDAVSLSQIRIIGILEFLAAVGIVLPQLLNIYPILSPIAAIGLILTMIVAIGLHIKIKDTGKIGVNIALLLLSALVALGRFGVI